MCQSSHMYRESDVISILIRMLYSQIFTWDAKLAHRGLDIKLFTPWPTEPLRPHPQAFKITHPVSKAGSRFNRLVFTLKTRIFSTNTDIYVYRYIYIYIIYIYKGRVYVCLLKTSSLLSSLSDRKMV